MAQLFEIFNFRPFKYLNFGNSYPFIYLKANKGTSLGQRLSAWAIIGSTLAPPAWTAQSTAPPIRGDKYSFRPQAYCWSFLNKQDRLAEVSPCFTIS